MMILFLLILFLISRTMKLKAEPCINNYLTIHVPAASLLNEYRAKKKEKQSEDKNPFMNAKLQMLKKSQSQNNKDIKCIYTSLPTKSYGKKKKIQAIPLLKNIKMNTDMKLRIVKQQNKNVYNLVFEKKRRNPQVLLKTQSERGLITQTSRRSIPRNFLTSESLRRFSSHPPIEFRQTAPIKIDSVQWPQRQQQTRPMQLKISGNPAPTSQTVDHLKKSSKEIPSTRRSLLYKDLYSSHKELQEYI